MQLRKGATVYAADGSKLGNVERVVLEPRTKEVTHIVVDKGFLFGEDKVVPVSLIGAVEDDADVHLRQDAGELDLLPDFVETEFVPSGVAEAADDHPVDYARSLYWVPPVGVAWWHGFGWPNYVANEIVRVKEVNIPEGTVALEEGAKVIAADGEHVGQVEAVLTEPQADRATHLIVSEGLFFPDRKLVPAQWVNMVLEKEVHLAVPARLLEELPEYEPSDG